ncbi:MAG: cupredoxin family copper-binding protein [archaeon]
MKNKIFFVFLVLALFFIAGCSTNTPNTNLGTTQNPQGDVPVEQNLQNNNQNTPQASPTPSNPSTSSTPPIQPSNPQNYNIEVRGFAFSPPTLTIHRGDTVTWTNYDSVGHTITSDSGNELNSMTFSDGQTYSHTFNTVGTYAYHCTPHPNMKGTIIVQ